MIRSFQNIDKTLRLCLMLMLTALVAPAFTSCINDSSDCPIDEGGPSDTYTFSFQMVTNNIGQSRALDEGDHDETYSEWPAFEDQILATDFAFFIFLQNQDGEWPMIMSMTDMVNNKNAAITINGYAGMWMVTAAIAKKELEAKLGYQLSKNDTRKINLRVAVLANVGGGETHATKRYDYTRLIKENFTDFIKEADNMVFSMSTIHSVNDGASGVDGIYKGAIPMYGMNEFSVTSDDLYYSDKVNPAWMGEVDMLRALSKIRVVDTIENKDDEGYPYIDNVDIVSATPQCYVTPYDAVNFKGVQTDYPRITGVSADGSTHILKLGYLQTKKDTFFGYVPEQTITSTSPALRITVVFGKNENGTDNSKVYEVPMSGYNDENFRDNFGQYILRNHIYTLNVTGVATDTPLDLEVEVADWTPAEFMLDYNQTVVVPEPFKLRFSNQEGAVDQTTGTVICKPWTTTADGTMTWSPITCTFGIQSPLGATWMAYLNVFEGDQDAFAFLDENGDMQPHLTGVVDNKTSSIRIVTQNKEPDVTSKARLQVYVQFADNSMVEVDLTPQNSPEYKSYTIVQNPL
ncbi:MAG: hypothetical protein K2K55_05805 [Duncaniella sp.]|nr:hypothetical protein [Duncaniella sp.]